MEIVQAIGDDLFSKRKVHCKEFKNGLDEIQLYL